MRTVIKYFTSFKLKTSRFFCLNTLSSFFVDLLPISILEKWMERNCFIVHSELCWSNQLQSIDYYYA